MVETGKVAPDFELPNDAGENVRLSDLRGQMVVLYFYPKDNTSGCTTQALEFTAQARAFKKAGSRIIGVSPDSVKSHKNFIDKHELGIELLADEEKTALNAYGVWVEKSMYGRKYMGVERSTFLIGPDGKVSQVWRKVKVKGHVDEVLGAVKSAQS